MMGIMSKELANPGSQYRAKSFWAWNGNLELSKEKNVNP